MTKTGLQETCLFINNQKTRSPIYLFILTSTEYDSIYILRKRILNS